MSSPMSSASHLTQYYEADYVASVTENTLRDESPIPCDDQTNFTFDSCFNDAIYKVCNKLFCVLSKDNTYSQNIENLMSF